jgi:predicted RNA-binding protein with EMAP domain
MVNDLYLILAAFCISTSVAVYCYLSKQEMIRTLARLEQTVLFLDSQLAGALRFNQEFIKHAEDVGKALTEADKRITELAEKTMNDKADPTKLHINEIMANMGRGALSDEDFE